MLFLSPFQVREQAGSLTHQNKDTCLSTGSGAKDIDSSPPPRKNYPPKPAFTSRAPTTPLTSKSSHYISTEKEGDREGEGEKERGTRRTQQEKENSPCQKLRLPCSPRCTDLNIEASCSIAPERWGERTSKRLRANSERSSERLNPEILFMESDSSNSLNKCLN